MIDHISKLTEEHCTKHDLSIYTKYSSILGDIVLSEAIITRESSILCKIYYNEKDVNIIPVDNKFPEEIVKFKPDTNKKLRQFILQLNNFYKD